MERAPRQQHAAARIAPAAGREPAGETREREGKVVCIGWPGEVQRMRIVTMCYDPAES